MENVKKGKRSRRALNEMAVAVITALVTVVPAFADTNGGLSSQLTSPIKQGLSEVYSLMTAIVLPIAVIVLAICAIKIIWGNTKSAEEGKATIVRVIIALALIYLAPLLISTVSGWFSSYSTQGGIFN